MRRSLAYFLILSWVVTSCTSSPDQATTTAVAAVAYTQTAAPTPTATPTATPIATFTPIPTHTPIATLTPTPMGGGSGRLIFIFERESFLGDGYAKTFPNLAGDSNIFTSNWDGTGLAPITTEGLKGNVNFIESISPDGSKILVSSFKASSYNIINPSNFGDLYVVDLDANGSQPVKIAGYIYKNMFPAAMWLDNSRIVYMGLYGGEHGVFLTDINGTSLTRISPPGGETPIRILFANTSVVYWIGLRNYRLDANLWRSSIDGSQQQRMEIENLDPGHWDRCYISPNGKWIIWESVPQSSNSRYVFPFYVASLTDTTGKSQLLGNLLQKYRVLFSYDGTRAVLLPFSGSQLNDPHYNASPAYTLYLETFTLKELFVPEYEKLASVGGPSLEESLSPDGRLVLLNLYIVDNRNIAVAVNAVVLDLDTRTYSRFDSAGMDSILWLPAP